MTNVFLLPPEGSPLREALSTELAPLVEGLLMHAIDECPEDLAAVLSVDFAEKMLSPKIIFILQNHPELLEHLYSGCVES